MPNVVAALAEAEFGHALRRDPNNSLRLQRVLFYNFMVMVRFQPLTVTTNTFPHAVLLKHYFFFFFLPAA